MPQDDTKKRRRVEPASTPNVIVDVMFDSGLFFISVENIGFLPAHQIRITIDQPIIGIDGKPVNDLNLFHRLEYLPPGKQLLCFLNRADLFFQSDAPSQFEVTVNFQDDRENEYQNQIKHDVSIYEDIHLITDIRTAVPSKAERAPIQPPADNVEPGGISQRIPGRSWKNIATSNAIEDPRRSSGITLRNRPSDKE